MTDGGIETTLIFHRGLDLPAFAAFDLLKDEEGACELRAYYEPNLTLARSPRRRASMAFGGDFVGKQRYDQPSAMAVVDISAPGCDKWS